MDSRKYALLLVGLGVLLLVGTLWYRQHQATAKQQVEVATRFGRGVALDDKKAVHSALGRTTSASEFRELRASLLPNVYTAALPNQRPQRLALDYVDVSEPSLLQGKRSRLNVHIYSTDSEDEVAWFEATVLSENGQSRVVGWESIRR